MLVRLYISTYFILLLMIPMTKGNSFTTEQYYYSLQVLFIVIIVNTD